jgi:hypothetical protein
MYVAEMGKVCVGYDTYYAITSLATASYMTMYDICGDWSIQTTGTQPVTADAVDYWMISTLELSTSLRSSVVSDIVDYGSSFRFYNAVDGYLRYIYVEVYGDGVGLVKRSAKK